MPNLTASPVSTDALPILGPYSAVQNTVLAGLIALLGFSLYSSYRSRKLGVHEVGGSIFAVWPFFTKRYDFLWHHFNSSGKDMFRFRILQHPMVAIRGNEAREAFFGDKSLNFTEGYRILMGGAPRLEDINQDVDTTTDATVTSFNKRILTLLRKDRLSGMLPILFSDINRRMQDWGREGKINPFREVYDLVFQMTVRMASCGELAEDKEAITKLYNDYWKLEKSATPVSLLFPWFPSPAKRAKEAATKNLFKTLSHYVDLRKKAEIQTSDAIDKLIEDGCEDVEIIQFVLSVIFAGVINTGINVCWDILYLCAYPEWKQKVADEVNQLFSKHTNTSSSDPLHKRLGAIPITVWEDEMPTMDLIIRETLRLTQTGAALRRNLEQDIPIAGRTLKRGDFVTYSLADVHLNPDIYQDPLVFDPNRYMKGREEDKKATFAYLGWGAGRHPCTGMKVAKLEIKMIVAMFLMAYEFEIVDHSGNVVRTLPEPNRNDIHQARPLGEPCYIQFKRIVE